MPTTATTATAPNSLPLIVSVTFGSVGSSWFLLLRIKDDKLRGLRWTPDGRGEGQWRNPVVLPVEAITGRRPTCPRPAMPTKEFIESRLQAKAKANAERMALLAKGKEIHAALSDGKAVAVTYFFKRYNPDTAGWEPAARTVQVQTVQGTRVHYISERGFPCWHRLTLADVVAIEQRP